MGHEGLEREDETVLELWSALGDPAVEPAGLEAQPEAFDGVEVCGSRGQILGLEVVPVERFGFMPGGVVERGWRGVWGWEDFPPPDCGGRPGRSRCRKAAHLFY